LICILHIDLSDIFCLSQNLFAILSKFLQSQKYIFTYLTKRKQIFQCDLSREYPSFAIFETLHIRKAYSLKNTDYFKVASPPSTFPCQPVYPYSTVSISLIFRALKIMFDFSVFHFPLHLRHPARFCVVDKPSLNKLNINNKGERKRYRTVPFH
jgi:hypothetical protein